jgi:hypothetical protein
MKTFTYSPVQVRKAAKFLAKRNTALPEWGVDGFESRIIRLMKEGYAQELRFSATAGFFLAFFYPEEGSTYQIGYVEVFVDAAIGKRGSDDDYLTVNAVSV